MQKNELSESDICDKFIRPAIEAAGWDGMSQIYREYPLRAGRVVVRGRQARRDRSTVLRADYALFYKTNIPLAVVEVKDNNHAVGAGMAQAICYATLLEVPFSFCTNGDEFVFRDATLSTGTLERTIALDQFPSPADLWDRLCKWKGWTPEVRHVAESDYAPSKVPRYYQLNAINRTVEAIACGQNRVLLVMATGTGKTYTAFQIIHRLWKSSWQADKPSGQKRILFLADRNILIDQTMVNDFRPFKGAMAKLSPNAKGIERIDGSGKTVIDELDLAVNRTTKQVDKSYEIYLSLYQAVSGTEESQNIYKQFSPDFFDLIVVDECHRGSADEDSAWREILTYFKSAAHVGLTATPKETKDVSNTEYFGEPIYTYSLRQGIEDGYLAPYKVIRVDLDKDVFGWRPPAGMVDKHGNVIEDRIYNATDMNRSLVLEQRDTLVAAKITEYLKATDRYAKTIVFCEDIDHASRMRQALANANADIAAAQPYYVVQITGDNADGKAQLDNFIDPEKRYPVIATTSKLLSTGVDAQTCKLIVIDRTIQSMTEFKQIIGRGTRVKEEYDKLFFTIMDFRKATDLFADPDFDGPPISIYDPPPGGPVVPPEDFDDECSAGEPGGDGGESAGEDDVGAGDGLGAGGGGRRAKFYVHDVEVRIVAERVQYYDPQTGQLITESIKDFTRKRIGAQFASLDQFIQTWTAAERKQAIVDELERQGALLDALAEDVGRQFDPFDLICHVAFDQPPLTRQERADHVRKRNYFTQYGEPARAVLDALLVKYADEGLGPLEDLAVLRVDPLHLFGTPLEIVDLFGGRDAYLAAVQELEGYLYRLAK
jgi:type I restriction enzyme R subunit